MKDFFFKACRNAADSSDIISQTGEMPLSTRGHRVTSSTCVIRKFKSTSRQDCRCFRRSLRMNGTSQHTLTSIGRWMFAATFIMGGLLHVTGPQFASQQVPAMFGAPYFWVYFTGVAQFAFALSLLIRRYDALASLCLCAMMLVFIATIHIPKAMAGDFLGVISSMRDFGYAAAALVFAGAVAKDTRLVPFSARTSGTSSSVT
jgi:uncharacterized membrane protein YphA (DoxX/SURF4 family)